MGEIRIMNEHKYKKRARSLFGIWCALYVIFDVGSSIYVSYQQVFHNEDPSKFLSGFQLGSLAAILLFFIPSLFGIYKLTKCYESKKLKNVIRWLLIIMSLWTLAMIVCTIAELMVPGLLT